MVVADPAFDHLISNFTSGTLASHGGLGDFMSHAMASLPRQMRLDVVETVEEYRVAADLPGVALKDVRLDVDPYNVLRISAVRSEKLRHDDLAGGVIYHCRERTMGHQSRSLQLPSEADALRISASLEHGVLTVVVPKLQVPGFEGGRRRIDVA